MIQKAEFDKLQFGDKLAQITENGELYTYKYIGRDPGWENRYAFLSGGDGSSALHYNRDFISKLFFYDCYSEIKNMADAKKAKYYRQWLEEDEKEFYRIKKKAEMTDSEIEAMVEKRFLEYVKDSGIKLSYEVNGIPYIFHYDLLSELNYEERGYPESVSEKVKHVIADDITEALNDKLKGLKDEALNYALSEFDKQKHGLEATAKIWKHFALIFIITTIVLTIRLFIQL